MEVTGVTGCAPCAPATLLAPSDKRSVMRLYMQSGASSLLALPLTKAFCGRLNRFRVIDFGLADFCVRAQPCVLDLT